MLKDFYILKRKKIVVATLTCMLIFVLVFSVIKHNGLNVNDGIINTNAGASLSNKKVCWGIKREPNHKQPDVGSENKKLMEDFNGLYMGNAESNKVYLTFDAGYEAGYTEKILEVLKENDVKACFFITAHYVNTHPELVQKMIDEGHTVRKSYRKP